MSSAITYGSEAGRETRCTVGPAVQREPADSLQEPGHARYADDVARRLHAKKAGMGTGPGRGDLDIKGAR
jgi:hypothetical protein